MIVFEKYIGTLKDIGANYPHRISSAANEEGNLKGIHKKRNCVSYMSCSVRQHKTYQPNLSCVCVYKPGMPV